jgi:hypothetical protein
MVLYILSKVSLAATHAIATIQAFVTSSASDGYMSAGVTSRCIALHIFSGCIYSI